jgi:hypothetical protein
LHLFPQDEGTQETGHSTEQAVLDADSTLPKGLPRQPSHGRDTAAHQPNAPPAGEEEGDTDYLAVLGILGEQQLTDTGEGEEPFDRDYSPDRADSLDGSDTPDKVNTWEGLGSSEDEDEEVLPTSSSEDGQCGQ